jgi:hypothetical protein
MKQQWLGIPVQSGLMAQLSAGCSTHSVCKRKEVTCRCVIAIVECLHR